jgi:ParB family chromosome partitioning protein
MKKERALGKGLDALIPPLEKSEGHAFLCPIDAIFPHPDQPRRRFDPQKMAELVQTVREKGVLSPVMVRSHGDGYQLISGERRWRAAKLAGLQQIPALVREVSDREGLELSLIENIQREDLTPMEEARAYQALLGLHGGTQEELAQRLGKDRSTIANALRLLKLPPEIQQALEAGRISAGHARCFLTLAPEHHRRLLEQIETRDLSVRAAEVWIRAIPKRPAARQRTDLFLDQLRDRLRASLATQVRIYSGKRKGKIVIEYYGPGDLDRIVRLLLAGKGNG